jgi:GNAT superfamily N-acetyltransferase
LDICFTAPGYRRRGVGRLLMDWGVKQADERGYAAYLDATAAGRHLYRGYGFVEGSRRELSMVGFEPTERKAWLRQKLIPFEWWPMYRPANGKYVAGETELPWDETPRPE